MSVALDKPLKHEYKIIFDFKFKTFYSKIELI